MNEQDRLVMSRTAVEGSIQDPLQFFDFSLAAGEVSPPIFFNYDYFRLLDLNGASLAVRFGGSGTEAVFLSAGIGYEIPVIIDRLVLRNISALPVTGRVALAVGKITDDRLSLSSAVSVVNAAGTQLETYDRQAATFACSQQAMVAATAAQLFANSATGKARVIQAGNLDLFIGTSAAVTVANGFKVASGNSFTIPHAREVWGICAGADTVFKYAEEY
jgi:hypothetical protein